MQKRPDEPGNGPVQTEGRKVSNSIGYIMKLQIWRPQVAGTQEAVPSCFTSCELAPGQLTTAWTPLGGIRAMNLLSILNCLELRVSPLETGCGTHTALRSMLAKAVSVMTFT